MQALWQDVRFGVRMLMKNRLVSLVCIVALALGIGANAAIFSMAEAFLLHPVPFENADRYIALLDKHSAKRRWRIRRRRFRSHCSRDVLRLEETGEVIRSNHRLPMG